MMRRSQRRHRRFAAKLQSAFPGQQPQSGKLAGLVLAGVLFCIFLPCMVVWLWQRQVGLPEQEAFSSGKYIRLADQDQTEDLEEYLVRLLPGQIRMDVPEEVLQAQAVLLRTWLLRLLDGGTYLEEKRIGMKPWTAAEMEAAWGERTEEIYLRLRHAVKETAGNYLAWRGKPILPLYHERSSGRTRTGDGELYPWMIGVDSDPDGTGDGALQIQSWTEREFAAALNTIDPRYQVTDHGIAVSLQVVSRDEAGYINLLMAGGLQFDGSQAAEALGLASACVSFDLFEGKIRAVCRGQGHGYGMSQYGAAVMAARGSSWQEILQHYFPETQITE